MTVSRISRSPSRTAYTRRPVGQLASRLLTKGTGFSGRTGGNSVCPSAAIPQSALEVAICDTLEERVERLADPGFKRELANHIEQVVNGELQIPGWPDVYVLGDAAHARHPESGEVYPGQKNLPKPTHLVSLYTQELVMLKRTVPWSSRLTPRLSRGSSGWALAYHEVRPEWTVSPATHQ